MKLSEILRAAKALIETRGWCQGDEASIWGPPNGPCCAATAISQLNIPWSGGQSFQGNGAIKLLKQAAGLPEIYGLAQWNDAPERTKEEVLAAYDKAITAAEAQEQEA